MLRKLKKALTAVVSAVLCVTMVLGITASAASVWSDTKALTTAKYNSNYIKWVEKYSAKEAKNKVTFSKSRTKKFYEKFAKARNNKNSQFCANVINKDVIVSAAVKDNKLKCAMYAKFDEIEICFAEYITKDKMTMLFPTDKIKITIPIPDDIDYDGTVENSLGGFDIDSFWAEDLGISENAKGKYFKFTSNNKTYYYEEFESNDGEIVGMLFNSSGSPLAMTNGTESFCFSVSFKVNDSEFTLPKGYKEADEDYRQELLESLL